MSKRKEVGTQSWEKTSTDTSTGKRNFPYFNWQISRSDEIKFYTLDTCGSMPTGTGEIWRYYYPTKYERISEKMGDDMHISHVNNWKKITNIV